jgi:hypothetical protein
MAREGNHAVTVCILGCGRFALAPESAAVLLGVWCCSLALQQICISSCTSCNDSMSCSRLLAAPSTLQQMVPVSGPLQKEPGRLGRL